MNSLAFNHRYGLSFTNDQETAAELRDQLVTAGAEAAEYAALYGRLTTLHFRLLAAGERLLRGEMDMARFAAVVGESRK